MLISIVNVVTRSASAQENLEYRIKAAFLFNFSKFTEWPAEVMQQSGGKLVFCIYGTDPFGPIIEETLGNKTVDGRTPTVMRVRQMQELTACHLLYLSSANDAEILPQIADRAILVVSDDKNFLRAGGMVQLIIQDNRVGFEINLPAVERAGLKVSAKLLKLAKSLVK